MRQYEYQLICFRTAFCFVNISAPKNRSKMFEYSTRAYGSQFSGEKNGLKIRYLVAEILSKNPVSFFLGHPVNCCLALKLCICFQKYELTSHEKKNSLNLKRSVRLAPPGANRAKGNLSQK